MAQKIKIVHFLGHLRFGGIERLVFDLVKEQTENNYIVPHILVLSDEGEFAEEFKRLNLPISSLNPVHTLLFGFKQLYMMHQVFKSCDILHLHSFHPIIVLLSIFYRKKTIYTEHGNFAFGRKKRLNDKILHKLRTYYFKWAANLILCNSNFTKNYLNTNWNIHKKVHTLYNGSNVNNIVKSNDVEKVRISFQNKFLVGTTSRLAGFKRIDRLINAFNLFATNKKDVKLIIVGDGIEKPKLQALVAKLGLDEKVSFTGFKSNVFDYQCAFDICVFPSQNEPFGLVAVEAYSANKPVLVFSDGGGLTEIVLKCDKEDIVPTIETMAERINFYYKNRGILKDATNVLNYFSVERMENDYFKAYKTLVCAE